MPVRVFPLILFPTHIQGEVSRNERPASWQQQAKLWRRVTILGPATRAAAPISQMDTTARLSCMAAGSDVITDGDDAEKISTISRDYFAPEAAGSAHRKAVRVLQSKRADQTLDLYLVEVDLLRRKAESKMQMGGPRPKHLYTCRACGLRPHRAEKNRRRCSARRATWAFRQSRNK